MGVAIKVFNKHPPGGWDVNILRLSAAPIRMMVLFNGQKFSSSFTDFDIFKW